MRRTTKRVVVNLGLFGTVLFLILFLQSGSVSSRSFAWSRIRFQPTSTWFATAEGRCPGLADTEKPALIIDRVEADGNASWIDSLGEKYHLCLYNVDSPGLDDDGKSPQSPYLRVPANRGHEAMAHLTWMIDNYKAIPAAGGVFFTE